MKKFLTLFAVAALFTAVACGDAKKDASTTEEATEMLEEMDETMEEVTEVVETPEADTTMAADSTDMGKTMEGDTEEVEGEAATE